MLSYNVYHLLCERFLGSSYDILLCCSPQTTNHKKVNAIPIHHNTFTKYTLVNYYYGRLGHNDKMDRLRYLYFISYRPKSISLYKSLKKTKLKSYKKLSNISFCTIYMAYFWRKVLSRNSYRTSFLGSVFAYITQQKLMLNKAVSCCVELPRSTQEIYPIHVYISFYKII